MNSIDIFKWLLLGICVVLIVAPLLSGRREKKPSSPEGDPS